VGFLKGRLFFQYAVSVGEFDVGEIEILIYPPPGPLPAGMEGELI
jgi:hypothetical protein